MKLYSKILLAATHCSALLAGCSSDPAETTRPSAHPSPPLATKAVSSVETAPTFSTTETEGPAHPQDPAPHRHHSGSASGSCKDLSTLTNLVGLPHLNATKNQIADASPLAELANLKELLMMDNPVTDHSVLEHLPLVFWDDCGTF